MTRRAIGVSERPPLLQTIPLSLQHLFAMFGATVLVPILFHINPATVLLFNGIGTLLYLFICKGKIPAYLGSSFAFISPVLLLLPLGYEVALGGFIMCGVLFCLVSFIVKKAGTGWLDVMFPPAAMGASGIRVLIESKVDYSKAQNLILTSVILIIGVSGAKVHIGAAELKGMALATIVGIALSLIFKLISVLRPEEVVLDAADSEEFK
ncbi:solute carrier family 23 protein [Klebsiella pneumoniae]